ncbi:MAG TPA: hypothetical protein VHQ47_13285 [Phycisphaerae bacterium]|nr:hypothetical protein [Phycisphaerae bacterium]
MARRSGWIAALGMPPLREHWREINREAREAQAQERATHKTRDQRRPRCRCQAYPWPHRPGGGLCRYPDPPVERYQRKAGGRPYRTRYAGLRRQIARNNGLHPIRDRAAIDALLPQALMLAKQLHQQHPKYKYRNIEITDNGVTVYWTTAGPSM